MASNNTAPDIEVIPDGGAPANQNGGAQQESPAGIMGRTVLGISPFTWAILIGAGAMQYFSASGDPPTTERKKRTEQELLQEAAGMNPETLQEIKKWAETYVGNLQMPGMVVTVAHRGTVVYNEAFGSYSTDTILALQEMSQSIVAAAFLTLVDDKTVSLDDKVSKYIPSFKEFRVLKQPPTQKGSGYATDPLKEPIRIKHLLNHTWGFAAGRPFHSGDTAIKTLDFQVQQVYNKILNAKQADAADIFENQLVKIPLIFQPGHGFRKSHGIEVLSYIITKITGKTIDEFVKIKILRPLNMGDTDWCVSSDNAVRATEQHLAVPAYTGKLGLYLTGEDEGHTSWLGWRTTSTKRTAPTILPSGKRMTVNGIYSTSSDIMKFLSFLSNSRKGSNSMILSLEMRRLMTRTDTVGGMLSNPDFNTHSKDKGSSAGHHPNIGLNSPGQTVGMGGFSIIMDPATSNLAGSKNTFSYLGDLGTEYWSDPVQGIEVFFGTQVAPFHAFPQIRQELAALVYGSLLPPSAAKFFSPPNEQQPSTMMNTMMNMMMYMMMFMPMGAM